MTDGVLENVCQYFKICLDEIGNDKLLTNRGSQTTTARTTRRV